MFILVILSERKADMKPCARLLTYFVTTCSLSTPSVAAWALLGFALRDSAGGAPKAGAARTRGGTLAGGATRIRGASGSERPRERR